MTGHTPGPWTFDYDKDKANATLIVAAGAAATEAEKLGFDGLAAIQALPELLKAFSAFDGIEHVIEPERRALAEARAHRERRAALAKAKGQS